MTQNGDDMNTTAVPADLMRLGDAAKQFGVSARTIREWIRTGKIAKYVQGGYWVYVSAGEIARLRRIERAD